MSLGKEFLKELLLESEVTRTYLASVPFEKKDFKPSDKSETLGRLAIHVAEITAWWTHTVTSHKLDFAGFVPEDINDTVQLLGYFDGLLAEAKKHLMKVKDEEFEKDWSMVYGEHVVFTLPKKQVARRFCMNHLIHHRAQLGVYLRLLGIFVPAVYGPSADDDQVLLIKNFNSISLD